MFVGKDRNEATLANRTGMDPSPRLRYSPLAITILSFL